MGVREYTGGLKIVDALTLEQAAKEVNDARLKRADDIAARVVDEIVKLATKVAKTGETSASIGIKKTMFNSPEYLPQDLSLASYDRQRYQNEGYVNSTALERVMQILCDELFFEAKEHTTRDTVEFSISWHDAERRRQTRQQYHPDT